MCPDRLGMASFARIPGLTLDHAVADGRVAFGAFVAVEASDPGFEVDIGFATLGI